MANDITKAIVANPIKNGTIIVGCKVTGVDSNDLLNSYVKNTPTITDIQDKYDARFDDPSYYYGGGNVDGGNVDSDNVDGGNV
jgi:hypothetical protein